MKKIMTVFGAMLLVSFILIGCGPSACDCARILDVPTYRITETGMPHPVNRLSNEEFKKYEECYEAYAGPATAILKCAGK